MEFAVLIQFKIGQVHVLGQLGKQLLTIQAVLLRLLEVGIDEADQFVVILHDQRLDHIRHIVHNAFNLLRIDVLSRRA